MSRSLSTAEWMDVLNETLVEVTSTALGMPASRLSTVRHGIPEGLEGAYLALVGQDDSIQIGLASNAEGCQFLTKALLQMDASEPDMESSDVADAMCEIVNIIAGGIKGRVHGRVAPIKLGLPIFVKGSVQPTGRTVLLVADMLIGHIPVALVLIEPRGASGTV